MYKYKDQKELRTALNGKMINMMIGAFLLINAITGTIRYAVNFSGIAMGVQDGVQEYVDMVTEAGIETWSLWVAAALFLVAAIAEVFVGMLAIRLSNRLDRAYLVKKSAIILLVIEAVLHIVLFIIKLPYLSVIFTSLFLPGALIWSASGMKKLSAKYPDRMYATEPRQKNGKGKSGKQQDAQKPKKSIMERAKTTVKEDTDNE
ncbi:MAG: hypothetical protein U0L12_04245 [Ruminococcus sp.]|nr:hypothetical protein [Ruminococcus sp.]